MEAEHELQKQHSVAHQHAASLSIKLGDGCPSTTGEDDSEETEVNLIEFFHGLLVDAKPGVSSGKDHGN